MLFVRGKKLIRGLYNLCNVDCREVITILSKRLEDNIVITRCLQYTFQCLLINAVIVNCLLLVDQGL